MPKISPVGLFCCDRFEETPNEKVVNMSKLTKSYFDILPELLCSRNVPGHVIYSLWFNEKVHVI